jgi:hypothetical protein
MGRNREMNRWSSRAISRGALSQAQNRPAIGRQVSDALKPCTEAFVESTSGMKTRLWTFLVEPPFYRLS